jgi:hypothetical protein
MGFQQAGHRYVHKQSILQQILSRRYQVMQRLFKFTLFVTAMLLLACAGPAPDPEPGMEFLHHGYSEEMQVATDVDWSGYSKIILHTAPVEFMDHWIKKQERLHGKAIRDKDVERVKNVVAEQFAEAMRETLSEKGGYQLTSESGPGVMTFLPNITDVDIEALGLVQNSILESLSDTRGEMTIELVIRDSVSDKLLAVAWQKQSDPHEGEMEMTINVSNSLAFRLMSESWSNWLLAHLDEARTGS